MSGRNENLLELRNIRKVFPGVVALDEMNFVLRPNQVHAICGENGAGKSTLIKTIAGVYQPDGGDIFVNGEKVKIADPGVGHQLGVSVIYQETSLFPDLTVAENLFIAREPVAGALKTLDYRQMRKDAADILKTMDCDIDITRRVKDLSMAQMQLIEIAKAISYHCKILILDEPTASLSSREVEVLFRVIGSLREQGVSMIYISHRLEEIYQIADHVTVIRDGKYVDDAPVAEVTQEQLVAWMVGRSMDHYYPKEPIPLGGTVLELRGLGQQGVLEDINFSIRAGEIVGFSGIVGAGRTELALAVCGFTRPDAGEIRVDGKPVAIASYQDANGCGIVYVSEDRANLGLIKKMNIRENVSMSVLKHLHKGPFIDAAAEKALAQEHIEKLKIRTPGTEFLTDNLSGGNQQKVSLAKAIAAKPRVLILDEPTRGVDIGAKAEIYSIMTELAREGLAILMISSELPEILGMSDRVAVMKGGRLVAEFQREEADQEKILSAALGVS